jgi:hypothetical protein
MKIILFILFISMVISSCYTEIKPTQEADILSDRIIKIVSGRLKKIYGLKLISFGVAADKEGIWKINAMYGRYSSEILDIQQAREIIVICVKEFLGEINHDKAFRPYMKVYPFISKNLSISILNYDENRRATHLPNISAFSVNSTGISYKSFGPEVKLPYAKIVTETYEEALEISENQASKPLEKNGTEGGIQLL